MSRHRENLLAIYQAAIDGANGCHAVKRYLESHPLEGEAPCYLIAIGKAAVSMAEGAFDILGGHIRRALVITRYGYGDRSGRGAVPLELIEAGHPQPDENSLRAGERLLALLDEAPGDARFIFLISGGASALVEVLPPSVTLETLQQINRWLLGSGLAIGEINQVRRALSLIKGGRLISYLHGRPALVLLMSDVPGDDPAVIGSGLLVAQNSSVSDVVKSRLPDWLLAHIESDADEISDNAVVVETAIIASSRDARVAAAARAKELGYDVHLHEQFLDGDAVEVGRWLVEELRSVAAGIHIWSAETTVQLPEAPGQGGRCQQLALAFAGSVGVEDKTVLLAAGTDGGDGGINREGADAGAIVDAGTVSRGVEDGFDVAIALRQANAGAFLEASGDLISTGPTGTNVMDLIIGFSAR